MIATVLCLSVLPTVLCAFAFVYGLVFCIQSLINGEKMSESKQCRNMFLLAGGSLALLMLLPNPWLYLYASLTKMGRCDPVKKCYFLTKGLQSAARII